LDLGEQIHSPAGMSSTCQTGPELKGASFRKEAEKQLSGWSGERY